MVAAVGPNSTICAAWRYSVGFDDRDSADDVLNKALSFLLNLRACYR